MPSEDLKFAAETLETAAEDFRVEAGSTFNEVADMLQSALEAGVEQPDIEPALAQLQDVLSGIEDVRTQDVAATLTLSSGVIEGAQAPEADVDQISVVADSISSYVTQVVDVQDAFSSEQIEKAEAQERYNALLQESVDALEEQAEQVGLTEAQVGSLASKYEDVRDVQKEYLNDIASSDSIAPLREKFNSFTEDAQKSLKQVEVGAYGMEISLLEAFTNPAAAAAALAAGGIALIVSEFAELDATTQQFIEQTGVAASEVGDLRSRTQGLRRDLALAGLETSDLVDITTEYGSAFGSVANAAQDIDSSFEGVQDPVEALQRETIAVAGRLNVSGEEAAGLITQFQELAQVTGMNRENLQGAALEAANIAGVAPKAVFQDIAENSEKLAKFSGQSGEQLAAAAARARQLGTNIGEVADLQERILTDIPGFIQGIEQASAISPELALDPGALTRSAAEGTGALVEELEAQLGGRDFQSLDFFTKQRLEDALGLTSQQIQRISERSENASLSFEDLQEKVQAGEASLEQLFQASEGATALTELKRQAGALGVTLIQVLAPAFEFIAEGLTIAASAINDGVALVSRFKDQVSEAASTVMSMADALPIDRLNTLSATVAGVPVAGFVDALSGLTGALGTASKVIAGIAAVGGTGYLLVRLFGALTGSASSMLGGVTGALKGALGVVKTFVSGATDALFGAAQKILDGVSGVIDSLSSVVNSVVNLLGDAFVKALKFAGKGVAAFVRSLIAAAPGVPVLVAISASALALGGALYFAAPAIDAVVSGIVSLVDVLVGGALGFVEQLRMTIVSIGEIGPELFVAAGGVTALAGSLAFFAATLTGAGFASAITNFANLFGGGPIDKIERLAAIGEEIGQAGDGIRDIASGLETVASVEDLTPKMDATVDAVQRITAEVDAESMEAIDAVARLRQEQAPSQPSAAGGASASGSDTQAAASADAATLTGDERALLRQIASNGQQLLDVVRTASGGVYIDGKKVTDRIRGSNENNPLRL